MPGPREAGVVEVYLSRMFVAQFFAALAAGGWYFLWMKADPEALHQVFSRHCPVDWSTPGIGGARRVYTGVGAIDDIACLLVTFFTPLLTPPDYFIQTSLLALPAAWFAVVLDAASLFPNSPILAVGVPLVDGFIVQLKGGGFGLPLYWLVSHLARSKLRAEGRVPGHADRPAVLAAFLATALGALIPSIALVVNPEISWIALWQPFPIYVSVIQAILLLVFPSQHQNRPKEVMKAIRNSQDASIVTLTRVAWAVFALAPTLSHFIFVSKVLEAESPLQYLASAVYATSGKLSYDSLEALLRTGLQDEVRRFILWDIGFIATTTWVAGALSGACDSFAQFLLLVVASVIGGAAFGPGTILATPFLYGLSRDEKKRPVQAVVEEKKTK